MPQLNPNKLRFTPKKKNTSSDSSDENNFSYEVISTLESIGVHFRTSIDPGSYVPALYPNSFRNELHNNMKKLVFSSIKILCKIDDTIFKPQSELLWGIFFTRSMPGTYPRISSCHQHSRLHHWLSAYRSAHCRSLSYL